jgi:hypothetical protein
MVVAKVLRRWIVECFARAFVAGFASGSVDGEAYMVAVRSMRKCVPEDIV